ncbi:hypothetical protein CEW92_05720 [Bacillaceae bacterium SAS-127]|nr:hypothetical protein CEW92_05720 [Bacillaceae bacterium SAS-127]
MKRLFVHTGISFHHFFLQHHDGRYEKFFDRIIHILEVPMTDLTTYDYIYIPARHNQDLLFSYQSIWENYLRKGGHILAFGEIEKPWLPYVQWKSYPTNFYWWVWAGADLPMYATEEEHPLLQNMTIDDMKWHYHGVIQPHENMEVIVHNEMQEGLICVDRTSFKGNIYVTTLDPEYHYGQGFIPKVENFLDHYLNWIETDMVGA